LKVGLSIGIQRMVRSDLASSGVMFSIDTETGFSDVVLINAAYGLGENVVQGTVNPDEYYVFKPTLKLGFRPILQKIVGTKEFKLVYDIGGGKMVKNVPVVADERLGFAITEDEILTLARWACLIEEHYSRERGQYTPMDRVGERWSHRRAFRCPSPPRDRAIAKTIRYVRNLSSAGKGPTPGSGAKRRREDRPRFGAHRR
jgi:phosphoenolpyruvate synthase/pyruvate phosphate dikinase